MGWKVPFLWILLIPFVTVPLSYSAWAELLSNQACVELSPAANRLTVSDWSCTPQQVLLVHAPGLLNLVPGLWLFSHQRRVRLAALLATGLGAIRWIAPVVLLILAWPRKNVRIANLLGVVPPDSVLLLSLALWGLSIVVFGVYGVVTRERDQPDSKSPGPLHT
jgi:hypothetical protein